MGIYESIFGKSKEEVNNMNELKKMVREQLDNLESEIENVAGAMEEKYEIVDSLHNEIAKLKAEKEYLESQHAKVATSLAALKNGYKKVGHPRRSE